MPSAKGTSSATAARGSSCEGELRGATPPTGEILTLPEAAGYLRVAEEDVLRSIGPLGLPGRRIGNEWRFLKSALQEWLRTTPAPSSKEALLSLAGAWKDDPSVDELLATVYRRRETTTEEES